MIRALAATSLIFVSSAAAEPLRLSMPLDCELGETCFIQNYVDRDPSSGRTDFGCGTLTYDGHKGTDFALLSMAQMRGGVAVRSAADGVVRATRDGMPDILFTDPAAPDLTNRACGNAVVIRHDDGWTSQFCHLRNGSVKVRSGDRVVSGQQLGEVGLSGKTEFPHLHFSLRKDTKIVDPFQPDGGESCGSTGRSLWADVIEYEPTGMISAGFSSALPEYASVKSGDAHKATLRPDADALVIWVQIFGGQKGDVLTFAITNEDGLVLRRTTLLKRSQVRLMRAVGNKRRKELWSLGQYSGKVTLTRGGEIVDEIETTLTVAN